MKTTSKWKPITVKNIFELNKNREPLTPAKLRELSGWEVSEDEAIEIIHSIHMFCRYLYGIFLRQQNSYLEDDSITITPLNKAA